MSQASLARTLGVASTQVSRWRRGQVVPGLPHLQRIADVFGVPRATLDELAGYPVERAEHEDVGADPHRRAELLACQARLGRVLDEKIPPHPWHTYVDLGEALGDTLTISLGRLLAPARREPAARA